MRVFVTGATGFIGSTVVRDLLDAGHRVLGLARSDESAKSLTAVGAGAHRGNLEDLASLRSGAAMSDGVIHAGFDHDFSRFTANSETDRRAIETIGDVLAGSDRPLIVTAGLPLTPGSPTTEDDMSPAGATGSPRVSEQAARVLAAWGVHVSVVRMSQAHDQGKHALASYMMALTREKRVSGYIGTGLNRWPAVHRLDTASLYRLALEKGAAGASYHAVMEEGVPLREIAEAIGRGLKLPVVTLPPEEAAGHFGWLAFPVGMDAPASSALTQARLGWQPVQKAKFIHDLDRSTAFGTV